MDFNELLDTASAEAILSHFEPTTASTWRQMCRLYSKRFHTPLPAVMALDPYEVALHVFEDNLVERHEEEDLTEHLLEMIYSMIDPNYDKEKEKELEDFIENVRKEATTKNNAETQKDLENVTPQGGSVDLSHLEDDPNER